MIKKIGLLLACLTVCGGFLIGQEQHKPSSQDDWIFERYSYPSFLVDQHLKHVEEFSLQAESLVDQMMENHLYPESISNMAQQVKVLLNMIRKPLEGF